MNVRVFCAAGVVFSLLCGLNTAQASGFDNLGIGSMEMLFDPAKASVEFGYTYIDRNVDYKAENTHAVTVLNPGTANETILARFQLILLVR